MNDNTTQKSNVVFLHCPQSVDSPNADAVTDAKKFIERPRGRSVNIDVVHGSNEFSVPEVKQIELKSLYPHEWNCFRAMKYDRCGKNGKYICHPDIDNFPKYLAAFGPAPDPSYTLDRIDPNDLTYGPGKCEWAPAQRQAENKRCTKYLETSDGTRLSVSEWERRTTIPRKTLLRRVNELGWSDDDAVGVKVGGRRSISTPKSTPTKTLFPDAAPAHLQTMLDTFTQGLSEHHDCLIFLLEWKHIKLLEYIDQGLMRCGVSPAQVVAMVVERWHRFAPHKSDPSFPCLMYLKQNVMPAAHYYLCNGGTRIADQCPDQHFEPTTPLDIERDL